MTQETNELDGVRTLMSEWARHELEGDVQAIADLLAPGFTGIGPVGFMLDAEQWAARHRGDLVNHRFDLAEVDVRPVAGAAVGEAVIEQETSAMGRDTSGSFRVGFVAAAVDGRWKLVSVQLSGPMISPGQVPPFAREAPKARQGSA